MSDARWIAVGRVAKPHGVHGALKVEVMSDNPERFAPERELWLQGTKRRIRSVAQLNRALILELEGIESVEDAEKCRDAFLEIPENELEELPGDSYYVHELVGMQAVDPNGKAIGEITGAHREPTSDVLEIRLPTNRQVLIPLTDEAVEKVDRENRRVVINKGLFEEFL